MTNGVFDVCIVGSTPLSKLLAGLMKSNHSRRCIVFSPSQTKQWADSHLDYNLAPWLRPASWALLHKCSAETLRLVTRIAGRNAASRVAPHYFVGSAAGEEALSHLRILTSAFGISSTPSAASLLKRFETGLSFEAQIALTPGVIDTALDAWLAALGIEQVHGGTLDVRADGSAIVHRGATASAIKHVVLADDAAIANYLRPKYWPKLLTLRAYSSVLVRPPAPSAATVMQVLDSDSMALTWGHEHFCVAAVGELEAACAAAGDFFGPNETLAFEGRGQFSKVLSADGGPAVGRVGGSTGPDVVAGFGSCGAFFAPALARWLAGAAEDDEARYFSDRLVTRSHLRAAEFTPLSEGVAA